MIKLYEIAKILRSKNSGPFQITFDIIFDTEREYIKVKESGIINKDTIAKIYKVSKLDIENIVFFESAKGIKITIARKISSGTIGDRDVYGAQQHAPLMNLEI
ncbi:MAG: DUF4387 domain-containing protein [Clostridiales bacterium]|nr:DUF4387 domain-containing protein [Clostridiales bacterium]